MRYLVLLAGDETAGPSLPPEQQVEYLRAHDAFAAAARERGAIVAGEALGEAATATTLRWHEGQLGLTDGPYAATPAEKNTEQIGGFYLVDIPDLDQLVELCALLPPVYSIEVRPTIEVG